MSKAPLLPFTMGGKRAGIRLQPPLLGEHTDALLTEVGYSDEEIAALKDRNIATGN